jgi:hypothetical protein
MRKLLALFALWLAAPALAMGQTDAPTRAYAIVIGSNRGGAGQTTLGFAQRDAARMVELLGELGRTPREHIEQLRDPDVAQVKDAIAQLRARLFEHAARGEPTQVVFYYSGHARSQALTLGTEELPLRDLREALRSLPTTLTIVVLDACQSGAFSGVKGASPAEDFSISSVQNLQSTGIAVMASSTASELSQESPELASSYFTHHLLVALRGAGDLDRDGRVSLDEAYGYAYERTLSDTARTQIGMQHATLETELTGRGDVPLSYPVDADAQLALPEALEGRVLVQRARQGAVVAELVKARGAPLLLALPSGGYEVLVRSGASGHACDVELERGSTHAFSLERCRPLRLAPVTSKSPTPKRPNESWFLEFGLTGYTRREDDYTKTLRTFDYDDEAEDNDLALGFDAGLGIAVHRYLQIVASGFLLERRLFARPTLRGQEFAWEARGVTLGPRLRIPIARHHLVLYAQAGAGIGFAHSELSDLFAADNPERHEERHRGYLLRAQVGAIIGFTRHFGAYLSAGYVHAPLIENELGDVRESGGFRVTHGLRLNGVEGWW